MHADDQPETPRQPPLQFSLRTVFAVAVAFGLLFGTLKCLGVPPLASFLVLVVLAASALAALGLVVVIAGTEKDDQ
jgi:Flp pilus assembly protein TadB